MWKLIAIITGTLIAAFFALGLFVPDIQIESSTLINRSPEVVWKVFTDASRSKEWISGLQSMETVSGGHLAVGSHHRLVFIDGGRRIEMQEVVTAVEPGKLFAFDSSFDEMNGSTKVRLTPQAGATELAFDCVYTGRSPFWRSMVVIMQSAIAKRETADLTKLKALIEAEPAT